MKSESQGDPHERISGIQAYDHPLPAHCLGPELSTLLLGMYALNSPLVR